MGTFNCAIFHERLYFELKWTDSSLPRTLKRPIILLERGGFIRRKFTVVNPLLTMGSMWIPMDPVSNLGIFEFFNGKCYQLKIFRKKSGFI